MDLSIPSMALDARFPSGMTALSESDKVELVKSVYRLVRIPTLKFCRCLPTRTAESMHTIIDHILLARQMLQYPTYGTASSSPCIAITAMSDRITTIAGVLRWSDVQFGYKIGHKKEDLSFDRRDSASRMPKCQVINPAFMWEYDRPPQISWHDTIIYELHAKGFTQLHAKVPSALRGTYAGLATETVITHLHKLGVTAVELMPIHAFIDDRHLVDKGLRNYWGYNSIGFFAPEVRYSSGEPVNEFKTLVKTLHQAGIEIILDVVYNHTSEGSQLGPTLSFCRITKPIRTGGWCWIRLNQTLRAVIIHPASFIT